MQLQQKIRDIVYPNKGYFPSLSPPHLHSRHMLGNIDKVYYSISKLIKNFSLEYYYSFFCKINRISEIK